MLLRLQQFETVGVRSNDTLRVRGMSTSGALMMPIVAIAINEFATWESVIVVIVSDVVGLRSQICLSVDVIVYNVVTWIDWSTCFIVVDDEYTLHDRLIGVEFFVYRLVDWLSDNERCVCLMCLMYVAVLCNESKLLLIRYTLIASDYSLIMLLLLTVLVGDEAMHGCVLSSMWMWVVCFDSIEFSECYTHYYNWFMMWATMRRYEWCRHCWCTLCCWLWRYAKLIMNEIWLKTRFFYNYHILWSHWYV